jgi:hypothetical protein
MLNNTLFEMTGAARATLTQRRRALKVSLVIVLSSVVAVSVYRSIFEPAHGRLDIESQGTNTRYCQHGIPTEAQIRAGRYALERWRYASIGEKNQYADDIVQSGILIGMTQKEIVEYMGKPDAFAALPDISPNIRVTGYNCADGESQCDLMIELKNNGKCSHVYITVNL